MPPFGFSGSGGGFRGSVDVGAIGNFFRGDPGKYLASPEFEELLLTGYKQKQAGEQPTAYLKAIQEGIRHGNTANGMRKLVSDLDADFDKGKEAFESQRIGAAQQRIIGEMRPRTEFGEPQAPETAYTPAPNRFGLGVEPSTENVAPSFSMTRRPGRSFTEADALELAPRKAFQNINQVTEGMMVNPAQMRAQEATAGASGALADLRHTRRRLEEMKESDLEDIETEESLADEGGYRPRARSLAQFPALSNLLPQREKEADPLLEEKRSELKTRSTRNQAQAERARREPGGRGTGQMTAAQLVSYRNSLLREAKEADMSGDRQAVAEIRAEVRAIDQELQKRGGTQRGGGSSPSRSEAPADRRERLRGLLFGGGQ